MSVNGIREKDAWAEGFFRRSMKVSAALGVLAALFAGQYAGWAFAGRYLMFLAWALANLLIWAGSFREFLGRRRAAILVPLAALKMAWLVLLFVLCWKADLSRRENLLAFLSGFLTPFLVMVLKALGRAVTQSRRAGGPRG
jgi:hypothetical protein